ncbi:MAG: anaerobic sulfatase-maturation protein [Bacteroidales bacterium]|nr:anaerobic sulfatase-maturation protein [Bacteroidales bacterium]
MAVLKDTLTLQDAVKITGPQAFNIMIKPVGSLCNPKCHYCYYLDKAEIYGGKEPRMSEQMLEHFIKEYIAANDVRDVFFNWHGGEPLLAGLDFYRKAMAFQKKYADGKHIHNTLQTNATLITREWAEFFRANNFLIGVSLDGPQNVHDRYRGGKGGASVFDRVIKGIMELYRAGVQYNVMATVNRQSEGRGLEIYQFLKSAGTRFIQFMPVLEHTKDGLIVDPQVQGARIAPWSVSPEGYGRFLCDIFDYWVRNDVGKVFVNQFDAVLACWCGAQPGICALAQTCGGNSIIEHNGDLYPCDHFVYEGYKIGNVLETDLRTLMNSTKQVRFGVDKRNALPDECLKCQWFFTCHGECPKHRFNTTDKGETGLNALCEGYKLFFAHVAPYMDKMKSLLQSGRPASEIMKIL